MTASSNPVPTAATSPVTAPTPVLPAVVPTWGSTVRFVLSPGQAQDDILDLNTKKGIMAYHAAIIPISVPFDGGSKEISHFQSQLKRRADTVGWN